MKTRIISSNFIFYFILLFICILFTAPVSAEDSDDRRDYGYMGMGHMGGYMGYGGMSGHMGYGNMGGHIGYSNMGNFMGSGHMMGMGFNFMHMLDLSEAQRKSIREIHKAARTQQLNFQDKLAEYSDELYTLYNADKPDAKKISAIYKKIFDIKREKIELSISTRNKSYDVLTKEQQEQLKSWKSSGRGFMPFQSGQNRGMQNMMR